MLGGPPQRATIFTDSRATKKERDSEEEIPAQSAGIITREKIRPLSGVKRAPASGPDEPGGAVARQMVTAKERERKRMTRKSLLNRPTPRGNET